MTNSQKNKDPKKLAMTNLLMMIREFELVYNLSPELSAIDKQELQAKISKILNSN
ncbi:MAG: hypothetical protein AAGF07_00530 [Patescibacteria group bacterium]